VDIKRCPSCDSEKQVADFYGNRTRKDGLSAHCKDCDRARRRAYGKRNREKETDYTRTRRAQSPGAHIAYMKAWRAANPEKVRADNAAWNAANKERRRELHRAWYEANGDRARGWRARNPDRARENQRAYDERTRTQRAERQRRRAALKRGANAGPVDLDELWDGICGLCQADLDPDLCWPHPLSKSLDHIVPLARGGSHTQANLQWTHLRCNIAKGARLIESERLVSGD
jgi:5-methylcytosine-specific restriction endonuclease McrA